MLLKYLIYTIILCSASFSFAQKEAAHWYFGQNAGLDFTSGSPVINLKGSLITEEGCATISDSSGNLLFYTDGTTVWNRKHLVMPTGKELYGNSTSTQSAIIVPKPDDINIYYIFTVDWATGDRGLNYYTVDMTMNGGFGDVVGVKGKPKSTNLIASPTSEKITAIKVFNEDAFWVLSLNEGRFYVFKVDKTGVNTLPIDANDKFSISMDGRGYLKASPDGKNLISANMTSGTYYYDFDSATGIISNERSLDVEDKFSYGVEFSPKSKKLYISTGNFSPKGVPQEENLYQFTLDIPNPTGENINATRVKLHTYSNKRSALQVGIDGKIYRAMDAESFLGVINNPEGDGLEADYVHRAIGLGKGISTQGLPPFIQSFFNANILVQGQCFGDETSFSINSNEKIVSIIWDFGDGSPTSEELEPKHTYLDSDDYTITVEVTTANEINVIDQIISIFNSPIANSPVILQQCDDDTDGYTNFNLRQSEKSINQDIPSPNFTYHLKHVEAEEDTNPIDNPESFSNKTATQIFVRVENQVNCYDVTELNLQVSTTSIPDDFTLYFEECDSDEQDGDDTNGITTFDFSNATQDILDLFPSNQLLSVTYYENMIDALALQNSIDSSLYRNETSPFHQQIIVRIDNENNNICIGLGYHITLKVTELPSFDLLDHQFLCLNELQPNGPAIHVENPKGNYTYEWRDANGVLLVSNETSIFEVPKAGDYFVTAISNNNCERTRKTTVETSGVAIIESVDIVDFSENNSITVHASGLGNYEFALDDINGDYQDENYFDMISGGKHTIYVSDKNNCGIQSKEVVILNIPIFFTPNGDGVNDTWHVNGVSSQPNSKIFIFDKFGKLLKQIDANGMGWDGIYNGKLLPSSDYWYMVELEDGRIQRGHFSLIRR